MLWSVRHFSSSILLQVYAGCSVSLRNRPPVICGLQLCTHMMSTTAIKRKATDLAAADAKKPKANSSITSFFGQPKPVNPGESKNPSNLDIPSKKPFDKEAWIAKLSDEQKELLKLEIETMHESWLPYLKDELVTTSFLDLKRFLKREKEAGKTIFPPLEDVYSWFVTSNT